MSFELRIPITEKRYLLLAFIMFAFGKTILLSKSKDANIFLRFCPTIRCNTTFG